MATGRSKLTQRIRDLEYENKKLQQQLNEYREEHSDLYVCMIFVCVTCWPVRGACVDRDVDRCRNKLRACRQNQEVTVARLRDRVKQLESDMETMADERARTKENEVRVEAERAAGLFKEREQVWRDA